MKIKLIALVGIVLALACASASAQAVNTRTFSWDPVTGAAGYRLYCGAATGIYAPAPVFDVTPSTAVTKQITVPAVGAAFCAMKAYNSSGIESLTFSNEVQPTPPGAVQNLKLSMSVPLSWNQRKRRYEQSGAIVFRAESGDIVTIAAADVLLDRGQGIRLNR